MKYIKQFMIILAFSFLGELCHAIIPAPIPASVYGLVFLFAALCSGVLKVDAVRDVSIFLIEIMPILFIPAAVGLMKSWGVIADNIISYAVVMVVTTFMVMALSGIVTQLIIRRQK